MKLRALLVATCFLLFTAARAQESRNEIVIGQSLPLSGALFTTANRILAGAVAAIEGANQTGGIHGKKIRLVTLNDEGNPKRHLENLQQLVKSEKAVLIMNCVGDESCMAASRFAREMQVVVVGAFSGSAQLSGNTFVRIRPTYQREAKVVATHLSVMNVNECLLITDQPSGEATRALSQSMASVGIAVKIVPILDAKPSAVAAALAASKAEDVRAAVLDVRADVAEGIGAMSPQDLRRMPPLLMTIASPSLTILTKVMPDRVLGFSSVVPNPEIPSSPLVRRLAVDAAGQGPEAVTFEGLEGYVNALVAIDAIRLASGKATSADLVSSLRNQRQYDLGGLRLNFSATDLPASNWAEISLRTRAGIIVR